MKIVGFESNEGLRLGVVEGDQVIDLQAVDAKVPANLADVLKANNGDLKPLADLAKSAPASARKPLSGIKYALPVARPGKILMALAGHLPGYRKDTDMIHAAIASSNCANTSASVWPLFAGT